MPATTTHESWCEQHEEDTCLTTARLLSDGETALWLATEPDNSDEPRSLVISGGVDEIRLPVQMAAELASVVAQLGEKAS